MGLTGRGSGAVRRHVVVPRVSVLQIRRMAGAGCMAGPALALRPKRVERDQPAWLIIQIRAFSLNAK